MIKLQKESLKRFIREYISPATIDATFAGVFDISQGYKVFAKPDMPTAATYFDPKAQNHIIMIGTDFSKYLGTDTHEGKQSLVRSLLIHELGHTLFTHVDSKSLDKKLRRAGVPFSLLNLAEDARIEHLIKEEITKKSGLNYKFDWTRWFATPEITLNSNPESVLFSLVNTEGKERGTSLLSLRVSEYYERFLDAKDTFDVVDILSEWVNEFKQNPEMSKKEEAEQRIQELMEAIQEAFSGMSGGEELPDITEEEGVNQLDPQLRSFGDMGEPVESDTQQQASISQMLENAMTLEEANSRTIKEERDENFQVDSNFNTVTMSEASSIKDMFDENKPNGDFYPHEVKKIERLLEKIASDTKKKVPTRRATNRFNSGRMFGAKSDPGGSKLYKKDKIATKKQSKKNIMFVLDLSGSMSGHPAASARTLLVGANRVAKKLKHMDITVIGSKMDGRKYEYQTIKLPANENSLLAAKANGSSEGIGYALQHAASEVKKNDIIIFFTDGQIFDQEISKKYIYDFLKPKALSLGIYVGEERYYNDSMKEWFDELIVNDNVVDVVEKIIEYANSSNYKVKTFKNVSDEEEENSVGMSL